MELPSSPPLLPEHDHIISPNLEPVDSDDLLPIRPTLAPTVSGSRKRPWSDYGNLSSDPVFSDDSTDSDEELRAPEQPRRKRLVKGPWWNLRRSMAERERLRIADSGVFLGSDMSEESVDSTVSSRERFARLDVAQKAGPSALAKSALHETSPAEMAALKTINQCLDCGREVVDLSGYGLDQLSDATLKPLHQLIRHTHDDLTHPPSEDEFVPLTPSIQLFLSGNRLSSLPDELLRLANISVLSLRNNSLTDLPFTISRLAKLKELNVAQNRLQWLPWEMLDILHCRGNHRQITTRPNPFVDPIPHFSGPSPLPRLRVTQGEFREHLSRWGETTGAFCQKMREWYSEEGMPWSMRHELELKLKLGRIKRTNYLQEASDAGQEIHLCNEQLLYLASSAVRYFEPDGSLLRNGNTSSSTNDLEVYRAAMDPQINAPPTEQHSTLPSLFELSLRRVQTDIILQEALQHAESLPGPVTAALKRAARGVQIGNEVCTTCGKQYVIARAEWMEYWFTGFPAQDCLTPETVLPFLRRACSWACAQPSELGAFRY